MMTLPSYLHKGRRLKPKLFHGKPSALCVSGFHMFNASNARCWNRQSGAGELKAVFLWAKRSLHRWKKKPSLSTSTAAFPDLSTESPRNPPMGGGRKLPRETGIAVRLGILHRHADRPHVSGARPRAEPLGRFLSAPSRSWNPPAAFPPAPS